MKDFKVPIERPEFETETKTDEVPPSSPSITPGFTSKRTVPAALPTEICKRSTPAKLPTEFIKRTSPAKLPGQR